MNHNRLSFCLWLVLCLLSYSLIPFAASPSLATVLPDTAIPDKKPVLEAVEDNSRASDETTPLPKIAEAKPLPKSRLDQLAALLPGFSDTTAKPRKFELPTYTRKPPEINNVVESTFSPDTNSVPPKPSKRLPAHVKSNLPLQIARVNLQGAVGNATELTIVFNQPMIALEALDVSDKFVPATLSPQPKGNWHWIDTRTLQFQPETNEFANATTYSLKIDKSVSSLSGQTLETSYTNQFETLAPALETTEYLKNGDGSAKSLRPVITLQFNQRIDPEVIAKAIYVKGENIAFHVADESDLKREKTLVENQGPNRSPEDLATKRTAYIVPNTDLARDKQFILIMPEGVKGTEGPNGTRDQREISLETYHPLKIIRSAEFEHKLIEIPGAIDNFTVLMNNDIDLEQSKRPIVAITPAVKNFAWKVVSNRIIVHGLFLPFHHYTISVNKNIRDIYGQSLSGYNEIKLNILSVRNQLENSGEAFVHLLPNEKPVFKIRTLNTSFVNVRVYRAKPEDWSSFVKQKLNYEGYGNQIFDLNSLFSNLELLRESKVSTTGIAQVWKDTYLDLSKSIRGNSDHLVITIEIPNAPYLGRAERFCKWIEYGSVGMECNDDGKNLFVSAIDLITAKPLQDAEVKCCPGGSGLKTDNNGLVRLQVPENAMDYVSCTHKGETAIVPFNRVHDNRGNGRFMWSGQTDRYLYRPGERVRVLGFLRWRNFENKCDLELPGEVKLSYKVNSSSDRTELARGHTVADKKGNVNFDFSIPDVTELGDCQINLAIEDGVSSEKKMEPQLNEFSTSFRIEEFRRPEFDISMQSGGQVIYVGDTTFVTAIGKSHTGNPLSRAKLHWDIASSTLFWRPPTKPELSRFDFSGVFSGPIGRIVGHSRRWPRNFGMNDSSIQLDGLSLKDGSDTIKLICRSLAVPEPITLNVQATAQDLSRQEWSAQTSVIVLPSDSMIGLAIGSNGTATVDPKSVEFVVVDKDGNLQEGKSIDVTLTHLAEEDIDPNCDVSIQSKSEVEKSDRIVKTIRLVSTMKPAILEWGELEPGDYKIVASTIDNKGRPSRIESGFHIKSNKEKLVEKALRAETARQQLETTQRAVHVSADKNKYVVGDVALLTVKSPFPDGHGILAISKERILEVKPFELKDGSATLSVKIDDRFYSDVTASVCIFGKNGLYGSGLASLTVPLDPYKLNVSVVSELPKYFPGKKAALRVSVKDAADKPVEDANVALCVVDDSILSLTNYAWLEPLFACFPILPYYYFQFSAYSSSFVRRYSEWQKEKAKIEMTKNRGASSDAIHFQVEPTVIDERHYSSGRGARFSTLGSTDRYAFFPNMTTNSKHANPHPNSQMISMRTNLSPLAYYNPSIITDAKGEAAVEFALPDNLTRYRIMAIATKDAIFFGNSDNSFTVDTPLMVHPALPRFLNFGDRFQLSTVLENKGDEMLKTDIVVRAKNLDLDSTSSATNIALTGRSVSLPPHDRMEIRIPATTRIGAVAGVQIAALSGELQDATELEIPLQPPTAGEEFATYGQIDTGAIEQQIVVPDKVVNEFGGLQISSSSTAMQRLLDPARYLIEYPYGCTEQLSSKILGLTALKAILTKFPAAGSDITIDEVDAQIRAAAQELFKRQDNNGKFGFWSKDDGIDNAYANIQCAKALNALREIDFSVPNELIDRCIFYLKNIKSHISNSPYRESESFTLQAYAANVLKRFGQLDSSVAEQIVAEAINFERRQRIVLSGDQSIQGRNIDYQRELPSALSLETLAWLLPALKAKDEKSELTKAVETIIAQHFGETSSTATVEASSKEEGYRIFYSPNRSTSIVLEALIDSKTDVDVIPKLVKGLFLSMHNCRWTNTQENACALVALSKYFSLYESKVPNFIARAWLGDEFVMEEKFSGRNLDLRNLHIPMEYLQKNQPGTKPIILQKDGDGRLYYRIGLKYAFLDKYVHATSRGFAVTRTIESIQDTNDVGRDVLGRLRIRLGSTVKVNVKIVVPETRYHVAMCDSFPAGLEPINAALAGTKRIPQQRYHIERTPQSSWWRNSFEHQNFRDNRAEAFRTEMAPGEYEFSYFARATTPGEFILPPCKVEEMYSPETFGRTGSETLIVE